VAVEEDQTQSLEASARPEQVDEEDAAVAAEHHRQLPPEDDGLHDVGQRPGVSDDGLGVADAAGMDHGAVRRRLDSAGVARAEAGPQPVPAEHVWHPARPGFPSGSGRGQTQVGRGVEHRAL